MPERNGKRAVMLYLDSELFKKLEARGQNNSPSVKPGPMAAEIVKQYFDKQRRDK